MKTNEKKLAISLRKEGKSMNEIARVVKVSKASVSLWVRNIELTPEQRSGLSLNCRSVNSIELRRKNRLRNESVKRMKIVNDAGKDFQLVSKRDLKIIGTMLYFGEGGKTMHGMARVTNSDPVVIKIMMRFFREICLVQESKFRGSIHTYSHLNADEAKKYWSTVSGIPEKQFYKSYIKPSIASLGKRDKLPFGTFDIYVCDTKLFLTIMGWIKRISELVLNEKSSISF